MFTKPSVKLLRRCVELRFFTAFAIATIAVGVAGYQRLFSSFASYDDEGYVMVSLCQFMAGGNLYDEVYSQYGPAYYWLSSLVHQVTEWPVTHDITRFKTLLVWTGVSALAAAWLYRVTRSGSLAMIGLLFVAFHLERLAMEPGHPQELCLLAVAACVFLATMCNTSSVDSRSFVAMGIATALCLMTKINVGLFLALSLSAAMLFATQDGRIRKLLLSSIVIAMVVMPILIGRHELFSSTGYRFPVLLTLSIGVTLWVGGRVGISPILELRHVFYFWSALILVSTVVALGTIAAGTSWQGLSEGILLQHVSFVSSHYHAPPIHTFAPVAACVAIFAARRALAGRTWIQVVYVVPVVLLAGATMRHLVETFQPLYHGSQDRGQIGLLVSYFTPYVWIILLPIRSGRMTTTSTDFNADFARLTLCLVAALQPLIAHPVPGTQMAIGSLALVLAMLVAIHDGIKTLRDNQPQMLPVARGLVTGLIGLVVITALCRATFLSYERSRLTGLQLPGATRLRLPDDVVAKECWTVAQLRERADTFVCLPSGHNSLYVWSGIEPPTGFNATVWQDLFTDDRQQKIIAAIDLRQRVCVVVDHQEPSSLRTRGPLLDYLRKNFEPVVVRGAREIWQRRRNTSVDAVASTAQPVGS
ncbi:MAG: hypothetical protein H6822_36220 [Planctomycetaceae bacterium]|nr:hypothetical protein [Planctomycetales bacterium]MCB9927635.1 hypothetical protein [Planctomycetaceae bacterium]